MTLWAVGDRLQHEQNYMLITLSTRKQARKAKQALKKRVRPTVSVKMFRLVEVR